MPKIKVDGKEVEYSEEELFDAIDILRQDRVISEFKGMREQQKEIITWMNEQKAGKKNDGVSGDGGSGAGGNGGSNPAESDKSEGSVGNGGENIGGPTPPPALSEHEKQEQQPRPRKSKWWGDAIEYGD